MSKGFCDSEHWNRKSHNNGEPGKKNYNTAFTGAGWSALTSYKRKVEDAKKGLCSLVNQ